MLHASKSLVMTQNCYENELHWINRLQEKGCRQENRKQISQSSFLSRSSHFETDKQTKVDYLL